MNRRGAARLAAAGIGVVVGATAAALRVIPEPKGSIWPQTWSGVGLWIGLIGTIGAFLWVIFGPFLKERLRTFLKDAETLLLLAELVFAILKSDAGKLAIREIVIEKFAERIKETAAMWEEVDELKEEMRAMSQSFEEVIRPSLERIEESQRTLQRQLADAKESTAREIERQVEFARQEFRDHGGRRVNPR